MESSTSSLTFKGSIPEAISEAQKKKKLFVVYISGEDGNSGLLEQTTFTNSNVQESLFRGCVFLHLLPGSVDASQFSAIYPQKSVPSISAIGYNGGKLLWQHEGYVSAENLVADIEKACASLHMQERTAAVLMAAALSSTTPEHQNSNVLNAASPERASSSSNQVPDSSTESSTQTSEAKIPVSSLTKGENVCSDATAEKCSYPYEDTTSNATYCSEIKYRNDEISISTSETCEMPINPSTVDVVKSDIESGTSMDRDGSGTARANNGQEFSQGTSNKSVNEHEGSIHEKKSDGMINSGDAIRPSDVHLNIRLPDGGGLQAKFSLTATLRMVKNYVDENKMSGKGAYDLAIPYPRKIFDEQDMSKALSELGFFNREALIVVPHQSVSGSFRGQLVSGSPSSANNPDSSVDNDGGNFARLKRLLSYVNPLSYFGGSANPSSSEPAPNNDMWQYRPNPALRSALSGTQRSYHPYPANSGMPPVSDNWSDSSNKPTTRRFGSNIHTLNHDQDDGPSGDRNNFWNGNSTQYGGNDNK